MCTLERKANLAVISLSSGCCPLAWTVAPECRATFWGSDQFRSASMAFVHAQKIVSTRTVHLSSIPFCRRRGAVSLMKWVEKAWIPRFICSYSGSHLYQPNNKHICAGVLYLCAHMSLYVEFSRFSVSILFYSTSDGLFFLSLSLLSLLYFPLSRSICHAYLQFLLLLIPNVGSDVFLLWHMSTDF